MKKRHYGELGRFVNSNEVLPVRELINTRGISSGWVQVLNMPGLKAGSNALVSLYSDFNSVTPSVAQFHIATSYNTHSFNLLGSSFQSLQLKCITKIRLEKDIETARTWKVFAFLKSNTNSITVTISHQIGIEIPTSTITDINPSAFIIKEYDL